MSQTSVNVTKLPSSERPNDICDYDKDYLRYLFRRGGWHEAATRLARCHGYLSPSMIGFCEQVSRMKRRPSVKQLALLLSLDVNIGAQKLFSEMEKEERETPKDGSRVVRLNPKT